MKKRVISADSLEKLLTILAVEEKKYHFNRYKAWDLLLYLRDVIKANAYEIEIEDKEGNT